MFWGAEEVRASKACWTTHNSTARPLSPHQSWPPLAGLPRPSHSPDSSLLTRTQCSSVPVPPRLARHPRRSVLASQKRVWRATTTRRETGTVLRARARLSARLARAASGSMMHPVSIAAGIECPSRQAARAALLARRANWIDDRWTLALTLLSSRALSLSLALFRTPQTPHHRPRAARWSPARPPRTSRPLRPTCSTLRS